MARLDKIENRIAGYLSEGEIAGAQKAQKSAAAARNRYPDLPPANPPSGKKKIVVPVHIRWIIRRDMDEVMEIENKSFEFPWLLDDYIRCLRTRNCIGMIAEVHDKVVGMMIYELHPRKLHVLNFAVHPEWRGRGIGRQLMGKLSGKLSSSRRNKIMLEVRETNLDAQLFFRALGFRAVSVLRDFYEDTTEDAYLMEFRHRHEPEDHPF